MCSKSNSSNPERIDPPAPFKEGSEKTAVIGLGNTLRRDDGIGIYVLDQLQKKFKHNKDISFFNFGIASFGLVNYINDFKKVILLDAIDAGLAPASVKIFKLEDAGCHINEKKMSSHELSLADLLLLYQTLGICADVRIAGIQVKDTSYGLEMTPELKNSKSRIVEEIFKFMTTSGFDSNGKHP